MTEDKVPLGTFVRLGTLSHNRTFTKREWLEYGGTAGELKKLRNSERVVLLNDRRSYYPTYQGWYELDELARSL